MGFDLSNVGKIGEFFGKYSYSRIFWLADKSRLFSKI